MESNKLRGLPKSLENGLSVFDMTFSTSFLLTRSWKNAILTHAQNHSAAIQRRPLSSGPPIWISLLTDRLGEHKTGSARNSQAVQTIRGLKNRGEHFSPKQVRSKIVFSRRADVKHFIPQSTFTRRDRSSYSKLIYQLVV